jgi:peptidoglycan hydrolase CwlO-like protein
MVSLNRNSLGKLATFLLSALLFGFILFYGSNYLGNNVNAYSTECPEEMDIYECIEYLENQAGQINQEKDELNDKISEEEYQQLSLSEQIAYYNNKVFQTEKSIGSLEVDIKKNNLELQVLNRDIEEATDNINIASQEVDKLQDAIKKRVVISYKYGSYSTMEVMMNSSEVENLNRKLKYLHYTKERDRELLSSMSDQIEKLNIEKEKLAKKQLQVQKKRDEIEIKKQKLNDQKEQLFAEKQTQQALLAESQAREQQYQNDLTELRAASNAITDKVTKLILEAYKRGELPANTPVNKGDVVGFQGHTGFAYGSHLHFEFSKNPFGNGRLTGGALGQPVGSGTMHAPLDGGVLTQTFHSSAFGWYSIDLASVSYGNQSGASYTVEPGSVCCYGMCVPAKDGNGNYYQYPLRGEGAPVRAVKDGMFTGIKVDSCGGKYAIVDHEDGDLSLYLHLK